MDKRLLHSYIMSLVYYVAKYMREQGTMKEYEFIDDFDYGTHEVALYVCPVKIEDHRRMRILTMEFGSLHVVIPNDVEVLDKETLLECFHDGDVFGSWKNLKG